MKIVVLGSYANDIMNFRGPLLRDMVAGGHEVIACSPGDHPEVARQLRDIGVTYRPVDIRRTGMNAIRDLWSLWGLTRFLREVRPDIVLTYTIKPVLYGSLAARAAGVPMCFSMITGVGSVFTGDTLKARLLRAFVCRLYRLALRNNQAVFFQNPDDLALFVNQRLLRKAQPAVMINGSGVDTNYFAEAPVVLKPLVFLLVARILKEKGVLEFAEAARVLKQRYPDMIFRLVGWFDTNPYGIPESQVREWHEAGIVEYLGETQDVRPFIAGASVFVLPSYYGEGTPRAVLEALAMGRPVVTTDSVGCRETVIHGKNGFLVPVKNVPALVDALEKFVEQPDLIEKMGRCSRELAVEKYDVWKVNDVIMRTMGCRHMPSRMSKIMGTGSESSRCLSPLF